MEDKSRDFERMLVAKAWKDPEFKKLLLKNPRKACEECGWKFPDEIEVKCIEDDKHTHTIVLPPSPSKTEQLEDAYLAQMAGGQTGNGPSYCIWSCQ